MRPRIVACLPCRVTSTRLYAKPYQLIGGKSVLSHLVERLRTIPELDGIVLAISKGTGNLAFVDYAIAHGLPFSVGSELDVLSRLIKTGKRHKVDVVLRFTPDCPFICTEVVSGMIEAHVEKGADLTVMEGLPVGAYGDLINLSALVKSHRLGGPEYWTAWVTLFIKDNPGLFRIQRLQAAPPLNRPDIRITVDYPEDLVAMRRIYDALYDDRLISVREIIAFLDSHPEVAVINNWIKPGMARIWG